MACQQAVRVKPGETAQFLVATTYEQHLNDFPKALAAYRALTWGSWASRAQQRITQLTQQELNVVTERVFRTNQTPRIKVTTRNVQTVTIKAYHIDLETYFRKMHLATGIEELDVALIDPNKSFTYEIPDYTDYKGGATYDFGNRFSLAGAIVGANKDGNSDYGDINKPRLIVTLAKSM